MDDTQHDAGWGSALLERLRGSGQGEAEQELVSAQAAKMPTASLEHSRVRVLTVGLCHLQPGRGLRLAWFDGDLSRVQGLDGVAPVGASSSRISQVSKEDAAGWS